LVCLNWRCFARRVQDLRERSRKFVEPSARHNNHVSPAMRFFDNAKESASLIFTEFYEYVFAFDLKIFRGDEIFHNAGFNGHRDGKSMFHFSVGDFWPLPPEQLAPDENQSAA
jgi:hypothetical protein